MGDNRNTTRTESRERRGVGARIATAVLLGTLAGLATAQAADAAPAAHAAPAAQAAVPLPTP